MKSDVHGLIGSLYETLKGFHLFTSQSPFFQCIFIHYSDSYMLHPNVMASIVKYDYFTVADTENLNFVFAQKRDVLLKKFADIYDTLTYPQKVELYDSLIEIIKRTQTYGAKRDPDEKRENDWKVYPAKQKEQLLNYLLHKREQLNTLNYSTYLLIYFAVNKNLPDYFFYGQRYCDDIKEFNDCVLCKYGVISEPGRREIIHLAFEKENRGNIFAISEYAEILFYGYTSDGTPNYEKALEMYNLAAGEIQTDGMNTVCHPLCLFSLSYMYYNYKRAGKLRNINSIEALEKFSPEERLVKAINYAKRSVSFMENAASLNILGVISKSLTPEKRKEFDLSDPIIYFNRCKDLKYVYSYNNLALHEGELISNDPTQEQEHLKKYIEYLDLAAHEYEPWAANWLGILYLRGQVYACNRTFDSCINKNLAIKYFLRALKYHHDQNSAWAAANLIVYCPEVYEDGEKLFREHLNICIAKGTNDTKNFLVAHSSVTSDELLVFEKTKQIADIFKNFKRKMTERTDRSVK